MKRQTIRSNFKWLAGSNLIGKPIWFLFFIGSARLLGPQQFGSFMYVISLVTVVSALMEGGVDIFTARVLASGQSEPSKFLSHSLVFKLSTGLAASIAMIFVVVGIKGAVVPANLLLPGLVYMISFSLTNHLRFAFRGFEIMEFEGKSILFEKLFVVLICGISLFLWRSTFEFIVGYALAYLMLLFVTMAMLRRQIRIRFAAIQWNFVWSSILRPALPYALMGFFTVVYFRSATILIKLLTNSDQLVGYYNAGFRLIEAFMLFPSIVVAPLYPVFARAESERPKVVRLIADSTRLILIGSSFIALPIVIFASDITKILFGVEFARASGCVGIVVFSMIPIGVTWVFGSLVAASGRQSQANKFILAATALNIILHLLLIPILSIEGAALTTLITECVITAANVWVMRDFLPGTGLGIHFLKIVIVLGVTMLIARGGILVGPFYFRLLEVIATMFAGFLISRAIAIADFKTIAKLV